MNRGRIIEENKNDHFANPNKILDVDTDHQRVIKPLANSLGKCNSEPTVKINLTNTELQEVSSLLMGYIGSTRHHHLRRTLPQK